MIIPPAAQVCVAYYLWAAIYEQRGTSEVGGYTFSGMILYYLVAATLYQMVQPEIGVVLREIYDGTLTKYLFYPISFFQFKFIEHISQMLLVGVQLVLAIFIYRWLVGFPAGVELGPWQILGACVAAVFAGYLYFIMTAAIEVLGFWVETVWGLVVMLQIVTSLLGGKLLPLTLFPDWAQRVMEYLPFPYVVSFPTQVLLGAVGVQEFFMGLSISFAWSVAVTGFALFVWNRGSYQYSGTGM